MKGFKTYISTRIGFVKIEGTEDALTAVSFVDENGKSDPRIPDCVQECRGQLDEYFKGKRRSFSIDLLLKGTDFQKRVWHELMCIPYGGTVSYKDVAVALGNAKGVRAVGGAVGSNSIGIIIPCHRVIGADGSLTGFGGGLWRKDWLLKHESRHLRSS